MKSIEQLKIEITLKILSGEGLYHGYSSSLPIDDDLRSFFCSLGSEFSYYYACSVDKCPRDDTREASSKDSQYAYYYAKYVDKCSRDDTRNFCLNSPTFACAYAKFLDGCYRDDTYNAVLGDPEQKKMYIEQFGETIVSNLEKENEKLRELLEKYLTKNLSNQRKLK